MAEESRKEKALLDTEELRDAGPGESDADKVELDLDDAPFLDEEEEEEAPPPAKEAPKDVAPAAQAEKKPSLVLRLKTFLKTKKGKLALGGAGLLVLGLAAFLLLGDSTPPPPPPPPPPKEEPPPPPPEEPPAQPEAPPRIIVPLAPFLVEYPQKDGTVRFLTVRFALIAPSEKLSLEMQSKSVVLRDAIFYYLRNKDITFLSDGANAEQFRRDLLSVINQYLASDQVETILLEEYLIK